MDSMIDIMRSLELSQGEQERDRLGLEAENLKDIEVKLKGMDNLRLTKS